MPECRVKLPYSGDTLINRVKRGELDQGDAQLIEKLLNFLLTIVSLLKRKHTSIRRMKELLFGMKEKNDELAILGVDAGILQRAAVQSAAGPHH
jgi:hypothetical protein